MMRTDGGDGEEYNMNRRLTQAKQVGYDEFYTTKETVEDELKHYPGCFKNKVVYCNADNPITSEFYWYFRNNFEDLGLKRLVTTGVSERGVGIYSCYDMVGGGVIRDMDSTGEFATDECLAILREADVVVTNPPFSQFRQYMQLMVEYSKKFLTLGNLNAVTYKEIFPLLMNDEVHLGVTHDDMEFIIPANAPVKTRQRTDEKGIRYQVIGNICWFTNLRHDSRVDPLELTHTYDSEKYPRYDNYDAIEVGRVAWIPKDYYGIMGVPVTFPTKYNPDQFEILGTQRWSKSPELLAVYTGDKIPPESDRKVTINGKEIYDRIFIKRKETEE